MYRHREEFRDRRDNLRQRDCGDAVIARETKGRKNMRLTRLNSDYCRHW